jgi:hypothetical protein
MIEVKFCVRKTTPDASGPWVPGILLNLPDTEEPLLLSLDEAEELARELSQWTDYGRQTYEKQEEEEPTN